jgi:hypothetical protein
MVEPIDGATTGSRRKCKYWRLLMFDHDAIHDRGRALEDEFFHRVDEELRKKLRETMERETKREQLLAATGFKDEALLDHLLDGGFEPATVAALVLVPAVFVA